MKHIAIAGATSAIAQAVARRYAGAATRFFLIGRNAANLAAVAADLRARGAEVIEHASDITPSSAPELANAAEAALGLIDVALVAHGELPDQRRIENDAAAVAASFTTNALSAIALLTAFAETMDRQGRGAIGFLGSVAGDRGRRSNYVYGSSKAAVQVFLDGLAGRFAATPVRVLTFKLGFVDTPMTSGFRKTFLFTTPDRIAPAIQAALERRRGTIYLPAFWRWIMLVVRLLPAGVIARLGL